MKCKHCDGKSKVVNSRENRKTVYRRRECLKCTLRFSTVEGMPQNLLQGKFDEGFMLGLVLLIRSYPPLTEHAFNIFQEAGYEYGDFVSLKIDPSDREALNNIFSI